MNKGLVIFLVCLLGSLALAVIYNDELKAKRELFPQVVNHAGGSAVKSAEEFIRTRFSMLDEAAGAYATYVAALNRGDVPPAHTFKLGHRFHLDGERSTSRLVRAFTESAAGAYLTEQDEEFLERLTDELKRDVKARLKQAIDEFVEAEGDIIDDDDTFRMFAGTVAASRAVAAMTSSDYLEIARNAREAILADGKEALWQALAAQDQAYLNQYREEDQTPTLDYYFDSAVRAFVSDSRAFRERRSGSSFVGRELLEQAYVATPLGYVRVLLEEGGVNSFVGYPQLERIGGMAVQSLRDADAQGVAEAEPADDFG